MINKDDKGEGIRRILKLHKNNSKIAAKPETVKKAQLKIIRKVPNNTKEEMKEISSDKILNIASSIDNLKSQGEDMKLECKNTAVKESAPCLLRLTAINGKWHSNYRGRYRSNSNI